MKLKDLNLINNLEEKNYIKAIQKTLNYLSISHKKINSESA